MSLSLLLLVSTVVFGNVYRWSGKEDAVFVDGAESVSTIISQSSTDTVLLIHSDVAHENLLPQFAYYSHGLNLGWDADKKVQTSTFNTVYHNVNLYSMLSYDAVVLYKGWDKHHTPTQLVAKVLEWADSVLLFNKYTKTTTRQYLLYVR